MSTELAHTTTSNLPDKMEYARALAASGMIPRDYQQQPANVLVAIEYGEALGIKPIIAINEINVISGTPSPSASLMASLARDAGHRVRAWNEDDGAAVCEIVRADDPEFTHRSRWDEKKARSAGLWGKGHWAKDAETMLRWRAISECVRLACPEVLGGLKYTPDEAREIAGEYDAAPPRRVESEQVRPTETIAPTAPVSRIPDDLALRIGDMDDPAKLEKMIVWLGGLQGEDQRQVADLQALCAARVDGLTAQADLQPEPEPSLEEAQQTLSDVLDAEEVEVPA